MKIYSSRVDDVRQRRKEWEDRYRPLKEKNDGEKLIGLLCEISSSKLQQLLAQ